VIPATGVGVLEFAKKDPLSPQQSTVPPASRAQAAFQPTPTLVAPAMPETGTGVPELLEGAGGVGAGITTPQQSTAPPASTAQADDAPPTLTLIAFVIPETGAGVGVFPTPSEPILEPQQSIAPLVSRAHADWPPTLTLAAFAIPATCTGVLELLVVPSPT
jgi:hypothetical protein